MAKSKNIGENKMVKEVSKRPSKKLIKFMFPVDGKNVIIEAESLEQAIKQLKSN